MDAIKLQSVFQGRDLSVSEKQVELFEIYHAEILRWNDRANLISKRDVSRIVERHFLESAALSRFEEFSGSQRVLDLGTGGGFPGVPLKIVCPQLHLLLLDSRRWKVLFLKRLIARLNLEADVVCGRAEELAKQPEYTSRFDVVVSRAVAPLWDLTKWAWPLLRAGGALVAVKGSKLETELHDISRERPDLKIKTEPLLVEAHGRPSPVVVFLRSLDE